MIVTTTDEVPGRRIVQVLGLVSGNTVRTKHMGHDIGAGLKTLVGGEIDSYTKMMNEARYEAYNRMVNHATHLGADAVVTTRYSTSAVMQGAAEFLCYGTAVKLG